MGATLALLPDCVNHDNYGAYINHVSRIRTEANN
jgi:hypothetical protein